MFETKQGRADLSLAQTYTSADVARIAQVTLRQLQWWDERKVVSPPARRPQASLPSGTSNRDDCDCRAAAKRPLASKDPPRPSPHSRSHLLTDDKSVYLEDRHERIIELLLNGKLNGSSSLLLV
jgi:hypothetical protein